MDRLDRMNSRKNKVVDFPNREQIAAEAAEWIIRLDNDRLLETNELQQLREWLNTSPAHRDELTVLNEFWSDQSLAARYGAKPSGLIFCDTRTYQSTPWTAFPYSCIVNETF